MTNVHDSDAAFASALAAIAARGIAVRRATGDLAAGTHAAMIRAELAARCGGGIRAYVLWTISADAHVLHGSDADVAETVAAVCHAAGLETHRDGAVVTARAAATSRRAGRHPSPWRWLDPRRTPSRAPLAA
jgi:hypothetical protein